MRLSIIAVIALVTVHLAAWAEQDTRPAQDLQSPVSAEVVTRAQQPQVQTVQQEPAVQSDRLPSEQGGPSDRKLRDQPEERSLWKGNIPTPDIPFREF